MCDCVCERERGTEREKIIGQESEIVRQWYLYMIRDSKFHLDFLVLWGLEIGMRPFILFFFLSRSLTYKILNRKEMPIFPLNRESYVGRARHYRKSFIGSRDGKRNSASKPVIKIAKMYAASPHLH